MSYLKIKGVMADGRSYRTIQVNSEGQIVLAPSVEGPWFGASIAKAGTTTGTIDLGNSYMYIRVIIPTLDAATVKVQVAEKASGTYYDLDAVTTTSSTHNYATTLKVGGYRFIKFVASASQATAAVDLRVSGLGVMA